MGFAAMVRMSSVQIPASARGWQQPTGGVTLGEYLGLG
jgi:hypothetical protein